MKKHWSRNHHGNPHGTRPATGPVMTPQRRILLDVLAAHGPVVDPSGFATPALHALMAERGYEARRDALPGLLRDAEIDGLVTRDVRGRRTYRIALADQLDDAAGVLGDDLVVETDYGPGPEDVDDSPEYHAQREPVQRHPEPDEPPVPQLPDVHTLAVAVLDEALAARAAVAKAEEEALEALLRAEEAEERLRYLDTLTEECNALRAEEETMLVRLAEVRGEVDQLVAMHDTQRRRADQAEAAAAAFRTRCEELDEQVTKLKRALAASEDENRRARAAVNGYPLAEHLRPESRRELAKLMTQIPTTKG